VARDTDVTFGGFGGASPQAIFQIGSVTKVFTALLLAEMAERGEVSLSEPAVSYLPGGKRPDLAGAGAVTLTDLATHTSGLPRLPPGLAWYSRLSPRDPYARYPASRFARAARQSLRRASGAGSYVYSNYGFGLLGYLLGQAAGSPYETLVTERICGPLGLRDTTFEVPAMSRDRMVQGYAGRRAVPAWHFGALAGAGGLYSTAADMGTFLQACLRPAGSPLDGVIRATLVPRLVIGGGEIGLAWHLTRLGDHVVSWHNGMTGGFSSMIAFDPARKLGIAALANSAGELPSPLDRAVFGALRLLPRSRQLPATGARGGGPQRPVQPFPAHPQVHVEQHHHAGRQRRGDRVGQHPARGADDDGGGGWLNRVIRQRPGEDTERRSQQPRHQAHDDGREQTDAEDTPPAAAYQLVGAAQCGQRPGVLKYHGRQGHGAGHHEPAGGHEERDARGHEEPGHRAAGRQSPQAEAG
jgi:CubicO group peptidase (beta-lactamase class C family)